MKPYQLRNIRSGQAEVDRRDGSYAGRVKRKSVPGLVWWEAWSTQRPLGPPTTHHRRRDACMFLVGHSRLAYGYYDAPRA